LLKNRPAGRRFLSRLRAPRARSIFAPMSAIRPNFVHPLLAAALAFVAFSPAAHADDGYPREALEQGLEGVTAFRALIAADGRAKQCEITQSSGHEILDTATCEKVIDHGRFEAARDERGRKTQGWYDGRLNWSID
jgi:TonB family protein